MLEENHKLSEITNLISESNIFNMIVLQEKKLKIGRVCENVREMNSKNVQI